MVIPFCFNIFQTLNILEADFKNIMGKINSIEIFSDKLMRVFPFLLILFLLLKYFDFYSRVLYWIGLDDLPMDLKNKNSISLSLIESEIESMNRNSIL